MDIPEKRKPNPNRKVTAKKKQFREVYEALSSDMYQAEYIGMAIVREIISHNQVRVAFCDCFSSCGDIVECRANLYLFEGAVVTVAYYSCGTLRCIVEGVCYHFDRTSIPSSTFGIERAIRTYLSDLHSTLWTDFKFARQSRPEKENTGFSEVSFRERKRIQFLLEIKKFSMFADKDDIIKSQSQKGQARVQEQGLKILLNSLKMYAFVSKFSHLFSTSGDGREGGDTGQAIIPECDLHLYFLSQFNCLSYISSDLSRALLRDFNDQPTNDALLMSHVQHTTASIAASESKGKKSGKKCVAETGPVDEKLLLNLLFSNNPRGLPLRSMKRRHVGSMKRRPWLCKYLKEVVAMWANFEYTSSY